MQFSIYQEGIYNFVKTGTANAVIQAVAGSGKTTTIVEALKLTSGSAVFLAFNKSIAETLKSRVPSHVQARTFHSLCYKPVLTVVGARAVNERKIYDIMKSNMAENDVKLYGSFVRKLIGLARNAGVGALCPMDGAAFYQLVEHHDIILESEQADEATGIMHAQRILEMSNRSKEVDFDDLLYFAVLKGVRLPSFDWVFVDEAQDTNAIQRAILRKILAHGGRLIAVGDSAQAIYGFRGADSDAMDLIAEEFGPCERLPLSVTYRCAKSITARAQEFVPAIEARPDAPEGTVEDLDTLWKLQDLGQHDLVVCRNTKPLIDLGYRLLRARIPLRIMGRDIGDGLCALVRRCDSGRGVDRFIEKLESWRDREVEKAISKGLEEKAEAINDKAETLLMLVGELPEHQRSVAELIKTLEMLFTDANNRVTLATVHKAKGLEADTVWWLCPSLCPSRWAKKPWQLQQEHNIMYVAITRAKTRLVSIELPKRQKEAS
jgi:superfamily I DNA/RNA helicase